MVSAANGGKEFKISGKSMDFSFSQSTGTQKENFLAHT